MFLKGIRKMLIPGKVNCWRRKFYIYIEKVLTHVEENVPERGGENADPIGKRTGWNRKFYICT
jgi:hypothetical protein